MTEASVSFAGNLTDDIEVRYTESGIARAWFRVAVSLDRRTAAPGPPSRSWLRSWAEPAVAMATPARISRSGGE
jgi:single-stranded DNA-binding protein